MENNSKDKVLIIIRGGTLQKVFSTHKDLQIDVLDFDDEDFSNEKEANEELVRRIENLNEVY